jgi:hypothetical protein
MSTVYCDLGFRELKEIPHGLCDELKSMSRDLPFHQSALGIFCIQQGRPNPWVRPQEIANAWRRQRDVLDTWVFDFHKPTGVLHQHDTLTVIDFRSTLIQFPASQPSVECPLSL